MSFLSTKLEDDYLSNIGAEYGVEFSTNNSFFTYEDTKLRCKLMQDKSIKSGNSETKLTTIIFEPQKKLELLYERFVNNSSCCSEIKLTSREGIYLNDFVARYVFEKGSVQSVLIANKKINKFEINKYYQYEAKAIEIFLASGQKFSINIIKDGTSIPEDTSIYFYAKKTQDNFVVHCRILPKLRNKAVIKLCNRHFRTLPIPSSLTNCLLYFNPNLHKKLAHHSEKNPKIGFLGKLVNPVLFYNFWMKSSIKLTIKCKIY